MENDALVYKTAETQEKIICIIKKKQVYYYRKNFHFGVKKYEGGCKW